MHYIDYLANAKSVNYGGHGYGAMFCASIFDQDHHASEFLFSTIDWPPVIDKFP